MTSEAEIIQLGFTLSLLAGLATGAGAMLFVVSDVLIPGSHRKGFEREATFGLIAGFIIMMFLDTLFA